MGEINDRLGLNIRRLRESQGLSQEGLAVLADLHRTYIGQIERSEKNISIRSLERIARALNVAIGDLL